MTSTINRIMVNICAKDLPKSKYFYTTCFAFDVDYDSDWFVHLISKGRQLELGLIDPESDIVPDKVKGASQGCYITFVVDDVDELYEIAKKERFNIMSPPEDTFYGQRRLLLEDPDGMIVDISSPTVTS